MDTTASNEPNSFKVYVYKVFTHILLNQARVIGSGRL